MERIVLGLMLFIMMNQQTHKNRVYGVIRKLEEYGYVETKKKPTGIMHRIDDAPGGSSYHKLVRLTDIGWKKVEEFTQSPLVNMPNRGREIVNEGCRGFGFNY